MLSSLLLLIAVAFADCPDPTPNLRNAEQDAVNYFLADAQASLTSVVDSFGCMEPEPEVVARFFLVQAMIWQLQEDERHIDALDRAKQLAPEYFTESLGPEMKAAWEAVEVVDLAPTIPVSIRGVRKGDILVIDGTEVELEAAATTPGLHLLQLRRKKDVVFARVVEAEKGAELQVSLEGPPIPAPTAPVPSGSVPGLHFTGPIGPGLVAADGTALRMRRDVIPVASLTEEGRRLAGHRRRNQALQVGAITSLVLGSYVSYLGFWDLAVGHNSENPAAAAFGGLSVAVTAAVWEPILFAKRRRIRRELIDQASTVSTP